MDTGYDEFCLADPDFYDSPVRTRGDDIDFATAPPLDLDGWTTTELEDWLAYTPVGAVLPSQGWKVHVSACQDNAAETLAIVCGFCLPRRIAFKFVRSQQLLLLSNSKYADRGSSGKFVTIYPADETELEAVLTELGASLEGRSGPYILSDLRWGPGPLYVRYGGFVEQYCVAPNGRLEMAIADADGNLVPDVRGPMFSVPPWVTLPAILEPHLAARRRATVADLPYSIEAAIHFSNGGGVYTGTDQRSGDQVILKEARPHAGLSTDGEDAVARLRRERDTLRLLAGLDVVPAVKDSFTVGEHEFLVLARVEGIPLDSALVERYPLSLHEIDRAAVTDYTTWAIDMLGRLEAAVAAIHQREVVIGDLHPNNVIITADGRVVLIDFEVASHVDERRRPPLGDPGFTAPHTFTGFDIDRYALACMRLFVFLPLTALFGLDRTKAEQLAAAITELFPVPADFLAEAVRTVVGPPAAAKPSHPWRLEPDPDGWLRAGASMADAILASATPNRDDRLFPGDIAQFQTGGLNLAHGAAGVLYALDATGHTAPDEYTEWLAHRAINPEPGTRLGFYDGLHGVAHVLDVLGRGSEALKVLDICASELQQRWDRLGLDLQSGLAGVALNLAHFAAATGDPSLWDDVWRVAEAVADRLGDETSVATISGGDLPYAGLLRGSSGPALMFLRLYEHRADEALLDLAATALRQDLRRCVPSQDGTLEVDEGWRTMPYLADGSVGIAMGLHHYLALRDDEQFAAAEVAIRRAAESPLYVEPGLFYGRAGMILHLAGAYPPAMAATDPVVAAHVRRLAWHALSYQDHMAFPGPQLMRLSMDLATGTAGVLLAVGAALHRQPVHLPFLGPGRAGRALDPPSVKQRKEVRNHGNPRPAGHGGEAGLHRPEPPQQDQPRVRRREPFEPLAVLAPSF